MRFGGSSVGGEGAEVGVLPRRSSGSTRTIDGLWPRLLATYQQLGRTGARGFLRGTEIPPEHISAIVNALPPVAAVRKLGR